MEQTSVPQRNFAIINIMKCHVVGRRLIEGMIGLGLLSQLKFRMPQLAPGTITWENMFSVDRGFSTCAKGPLEAYALSDDKVDS
ncbi:hypothetical protein Taro_036872 [Colocasia esculenta]|uniref:Uncharacterized protein n=1 Tax=Colocasia esculenta TaxID=4460 RepID=A0A843VYT7_COLES|nr:hypothetical protein [Colocasia esculenta]